MSKFNQRPFVDVAFADNPEPRCPVVLLLDTSASMTGPKIDELNNGLGMFKKDLLNDSLAKKRVEISMITFGPVNVVSNFANVEFFMPRTLTASGNTPMGEAIETGVNMLRERKIAYKHNGISYYRPWLYLVTDGSPTDNCERATKLIREGEQKRDFLFLAVGVKDADMETLNAISEREALKLRNLEFQEMFQWLSSSLRSVSASVVGDKIPLASPRGWAEID